MSELILFHHAQGLTDGIEAFADERGDNRERGAVPVPRRHLFADSGLENYDDSAATLVKQRVLTFLDHID